MIYGCLIILILLFIRNRVVDIYSILIYLILICFNLFNFNLFPLDFCLYWKFDVFLNQLLQLLFKYENNLFFLCFLIFCGSYFWNYIYNIALFIITYCFLDFNYRFKFFYLGKLLVVNEKLINGLFIIHPILTYSFYALLITMCIIFLYCCFNYRFNYLVNILCIASTKNFKQLQLFCLLIGLVAIILGGWWAQQEVNWNGWWGWDFIEVVNLSLFLWFVYFVHSRYLFSYFFFIKKWIISCLYLFLFYMILLRWGMFNSIHTFLSNSLLGYEYIYMYFVIFFMTVLLLFNNCKFLLVSTSRFRIVSRIVVDNLLARYFLCMSIIILSLIYFNLVYSIDVFTSLRDFFLWGVYWNSLLFFYINSVFLFYNFFEISGVLFILGILIYLVLNRFKLIHIIIFIYIILFIVTPIDGFDFFKWAAGSDWVDTLYIFIIKAVNGYYIFDFFYYFDNLCSYFSKLCFFSDYFSSFHEVSKLLDYDSKYVSINYFVKSLIIFDTFDLQLFINLVDKLYNLIIVLFLFFYKILVYKRKLVCYVII